MSQPDKKKDSKNEPKKKSLWGRWMETLDKTMVEKANQSSCCSKENKDDKCC